MQNKDGLSQAEVHEISMLDATGQRELVASKAIHNASLFYCSKQKIDTYNARFNAVSHIDYSLAEDALSRHKGRPTLLPYLLKGSDEYPGFPMQSGSRLRKDAMGHMIHPFMRALSEHGMVPTGMTTMPELGLLASGESFLYGPSRNPWKITHSALGSSTGSAIAVATGMIPYAHASDAAGSIRLPASACGVVGFKPSAGFSLRARRFDMVDDFLCTDTLLARSVRDVIHATNMTRPANVAPVCLTTGPVRVGVVRCGMGNTMPADSINNALDENIALLRTMPNVTVEEFDAPFDMNALQRAVQVLWSYLGGTIVDFASASHTSTSDVLEPWPHYLHQRREALHYNALRDAFSTVAVAQSQLTAFHRKADFMLSPVMADLPPLLGYLAPDVEGETLWNRLFQLMTYTPIQNLLGTPCITLPLHHHHSGLPVGAMLSAAQEADDTLLSFASQIEANAPNYKQWQPTGHEGE